MSSVTHVQLSFKVAEAVRPDGVHPFDDPIDQWVIIHKGEEYAWAQTHSAAYRIYGEILHYENEHQRRKSWDPNDIGLEERRLS